MYKEIKYKIRYVGLELVSLVQEVKLNMFLAYAFLGVVGCFKHKVV